MEPRKKAMFQEDLSQVPVDTGPAAESEPASSGNTGGRRPLARERGLRRGRRGQTKPEDSPEPSGKVVVDLSADAGQGEAAPRLQSKRTVDLSADAGTNEPASTYSAASSVRTRVVDVSADGGIPGLASAASSVPTPVVDVSAYGGTPGPAAAASSVPTPVVDVSAYGGIPGPASAASSVPTPVVDFSAYGGIPGPASAASSVPTPVVDVSAYGCIPGPASAASGVPTPVVDVSAYGGIPGLASAASGVSTPVVDVSAYGCIPGPAAAASSAPTPVVDVSVCGGLPGPATSSAPAGNEPPPQESLGSGATRRDPLLGGGSPQGAPTQAWQGLAAGRGETASPWGNQANASDTWRSTFQAMAANVPWTWNRPVAREAEPPAHEPQPPAPEPQPSSVPWTWNRPFAREAQPPALEAQPPAPEPQPSSAPWTWNRPVAREAEPPAPEPQPSIAWNAPQESSAPWYAQQKAAAQRDSRFSDWTAMFIGWRQGERPSHPRIDATLFEEGGDREMSVRPDQQGMVAAPPGQGVAYASENSNYSNSAGSNDAAMPSQTAAARGPGFREKKSVTLDLVAAKEEMAAHGHGGGSIGGTRSLPIHVRPEWRLDDPGGQEPGMVKGPLYDPRVCGYYRSSEHFSDGMGSILDRPMNAVTCCCPLMWVRRLRLTLSRAAPVDIGCFCCCYWNVPGTDRPKMSALCTGCFSAMLSTFIFLLPVIFGLSLVIPRMASRVEGMDKIVKDVSELMREPFPKGVLRNVDEHPVLLVVVFSIIAHCCGLLFWGSALHAVARKYRIKAAAQSLSDFLGRACCCLCALNVRVAMHVDRAQGFTRPKREAMNNIRIVGGGVEMAYKGTSTIQEDPDAERALANLPVSFLTAEPGQSAVEDAAAVLEGLAASQRRPGRPKNR